MMMQSTKQNLSKVFYSKYPRVVKIFAFFKQLVGAIVITCAFIAQILAKEGLTIDKRIFTNNKEPKSYYYAGLLSNLGNLSLNKKHPELLRYSSMSPFPSPSIGAMLGLSVGRQMAPYIAMELALEWFISGTKYKPFDSYVPRTSSKSIEKSSTLYTIGLGLDCIPMIPVSDNVSLLALIGFGCKTAGIEVLDIKKFDTVGWNFIPRIGLGGVIHDDFLRFSAKLIVEFNNRFRDTNKAIFNPSLLLGLGFSLRFPLSAWY